jgi:ubiquilin
MAGIPGMGGMSEDQMIAMLDNPAMQGMMESMLNNPAMMQQMIASNPQLQALVAQNPEMEAMLRDPATLRTMMNPGVLRSAMAMRQAMANAQDGAAAAPSAAAAPGAGAGGIPGFDMNHFAQIMAGAGGGGVGGGAGVPAPAATPLPELTQEQMAPQLQQLRDMGFLDTSMCMEALRQARGNVNLAVEHLLSRF